MAERADDLDLGRLGNFIARHPEVGEVWLVVVANVYLGTQALGPLVKGEPGGWITLAILSPFWILLNLLGWMMVRFMRLMRRMNERDREAKRLKEIAEKRADERAKVQQAAAERARRERSFQWHKREDCEGPAYFPTSEEEVTWEDACDSTWVWTYGLHWEQQDRRPPPPQDAEPDLPF